MARVYWKKNLSLSTKILAAFLLGSVSADASADIPLISLNNTNFVVTIAFLAFIGIVLYLKVPTKVNGLLDDRSTTIKEEIEGANKILEESKSLLAELEREHKQNIEKAQKIISDAETEAKRMISDSKKEIRHSVERKVKLAEEQIKATEASVIKSIKDRAIDNSVLLAEQQLSIRATSKANNLIIEKSIEQIKKSLN